MKDTGKDKMYRKQQKITYAYRIVLPGLFLLFNFAAFAENVDLSQEIVYKTKLVEEIKKEISQIDSEYARCQKAKKGWVAATVVGGVGVVATGVGAIVQANKLKNKNAAGKAKQGTTNDD